MIAFCTNDNEEIHKIRMLTLEINMNYIDKKFTLDDGTEQIVIEAVILS